MPDPVCELRGLPADEMYVGYLPTPPRTKKFLRRIVPASLWALCGFALAWTLSQRDPGDARWDDDRPRTLRGTLVADPYPILLTDDAGDGKPGAVLIVDAGKRSARDRVRALDGATVTLTGTFLHRDDRRMIELAEPESAITRREEAPPAATPSLPRDLGPVTLRGEIIDSKCFLGAMKPGHGKTHKECATLCISGGIPPMLVTRDASGRATYFLLSGPAGGPLDASIYPMIADPVEVSGQLATWNGLNILRIGGENVRRL